jgi:hypothetical protein
VFAGFPAAFPRAAVASTRISRENAQEFAPGALAREGAPASLVAVEG